MSEKENEKILNFPSIARKNAAKTEENPFIAAIKAATEGVETLGATAPGNGVPITVNIHFNGGSPQIAAGNIQNSSPRSRKVETIDASQKAQLLALRDQIVATSEKCFVPKHPGSIMKQLNEAIGVKTYHQIPVDQFLAARKHLEIILNTLIAYEKYVSHREEFRATLIDGLKGAYSYSRSELGLYVENPEPMPISNETVTWSTTDLESLYLTLFNQY